MTNDFIEHNPMLKKPLLAVLAACANQAGGDRRAVEDRALGAWDDAYRQSPSACVDVLVRNGALVERLLVDGALYDGTLDDLQLDESIPDDVVVESRLSITDEGRVLLDSYAPEHTLKALFADKPQHRDIFLAALRACAAETGASCVDLEHVIDERLAPAADGRQRVYPQYFIDALETAGGISWHGAWRTTAAGRAVISAA